MLGFSSMTARHLEPSYLRRWRERQVENEKAATEGGQPWRKTTSGMTPARLRSFYRLARVVRTACLGFNGYEGSAEITMTAWLNVCVFWTGEYRLTVKGMRDMAHDFSATEMGREVRRFCGINRGMFPNQGLENRVRNRLQDYVGNRCRQERIYKRSEREKEQMAAKDVGYQALSERRCPICGRSFDIVDDPNPCDHGFENVRWDEDLRGWVKR